MTPRPIHTAPLAVGQRETPITLLLYCPEEGGWRTGMWLRAGFYQGTRVSQGWRLADDPQVELRPTAWLPLSAGQSIAAVEPASAQPGQPSLRGEDGLQAPHPLPLLDAINPEKKGGMTNQPISRGTVLLLEDEALIAVALQDDLEEAGYGVAGPFVTCASALAWLGDHRPDFAILDTVLKDGPCKEVALKLRAQGVPFAVYSGHPEDRNTLSELASATWVEKPAPAEALLDALASLKDAQAAAGQLHDRVHEEFSALFNSLDRTPLLVGRCSH